MQNVKIESCDVSKIYIKAHLALIVKLLILGEMSEED
jgi:hypothetical protein